MFSSFIKIITKHSKFVETSQNNTNKLLLSKTRWTEEENFRNEDITLHQNGCFELLPCRFGNILSKEKCLKWVHMIFYFCFDYTDKRV